MLSVHEPSEKEMLDMTDTLMTAEELATYLQIHKETVYRKARGGQIPGTKVGKKWRFPKEVIDEWIRCQAMASEQASAEPIHRFLQECDRVADRIRREVGDTLPDATETLRAIRLERTER